MAHTLLERTNFAHFHTVPQYTYLKLNMSVLYGVITISGNTERPLQTKEHIMAFAAEVQATKEALKPSVGLCGLDPPKR